MENREDFQIPREIVDRLSDPEVLRRYIEEGQTFQEILGFNQTAMDNFYRASVGLMHSHRYSDAADAFVFLTTLNPFVPAYWLGLGMCEQVNQEYKAAVAAYSMAGMNDKNDPTPHYYIAACYHALNDRDHALRALEKCLQMAGEGDSYSEIRERALKSYEILNRK